MAGHILIVDDVPTNRILLKTKLAQAYYDVSECARGADALAQARESRPDLILLEAKLRGMSGLHLCARLKADPATTHIPIVLTGSPGDRASRLEGFAAGADDFLLRPIDDLLLFARVRSLVRDKVSIDELHLRSDAIQDMGLFDETGLLLPQMPVEGRVLIAPGETAQAVAWADAVNTLPGVRAGVAATGEALLNDSADMFVVGQSLMDGSEGLRMISFLRSRADHRMAPILFVADQSSEVSRAAMALDLGASDYLIAPADPGELAARIRAQLRRRAYAEHLRETVMNGLKLATIDSLTGLHNRRYAAQQIERMLRAAKSDSAGLALLMLDLDSFKKVNDIHGHEAGDRVLREFARRLRENVRNVDLVARLGGEEFCVAMPDIAIDHALAIAERVRAVVESRPFIINDAGQRLRVTVSVGVANAVGRGIMLDALLREADAALYNAKSSGRNQVILAAA